ncbi:MAG TPA: type II toxin-antitoxin system PemK/MazF family toxin [Candidatus Kapabacteria bacterium]|nr:type II toxin-antitoxin system PemK/MazF family toxin [Candidatus Kapabacteria bacterium]
MSNFLKYDLVLVKYPFSDLTVFKVRPAIVVNPYYPSNDIIIVPLTSHSNKLLPGEFILSEWKESGLNVQSTVKRGIYTIDEKLVILKIGTLATNDVYKLENSLRLWLDIL